MKRTLFLVIALIACASLAFAGTGDGIEWREDFKKALAEAKRDNRVLMVKFGAVWCGPCVEMDRTTFKDKKVIENSRYFINVKLDADDESANARDIYNFIAKHTTGYIPLVVFMTPDGKLITRCQTEYASSFRKIQEEVIKKNALTLPGKGADPSEVPEKVVPGEKRFFTSIDEGFAAAKAQNRPILLVGQRETCGRCHGFKTRTMKDAKIEELLSSYITIMVDIDADRNGWGRIYRLLRNVRGSVGLPVVLLLEPNRTYYKQYTGSVPSKDFEKDLAALLKKSGDPIQAQETSTPPVIEKNNESQKNFFTSTREGFEAAKAQNLPILLIGESKECGSCIYLKNTTLKSKGVEALLPSFVTIMVDVYDDSEEWSTIAGKLKNVSPMISLPIVLLLRPDETHVQEWTGMVDAKELEKAMRALTSGTGGSGATTTTGDSAATTDAAGENVVLEDGKYVINRTEARKAFAYLNKVRQNPSAYSEEIGVSLQYIKKTHTLNRNAALQKAAEEKALDMAKRDYFAHVDPDGNGMNIKIHEAGYTLNPSFITPRSANYFESIYYGMGYNRGIADGKGAIIDLIIDEGVPSLGHRHHLLGHSTPSQQGNHLMHDAGIGYVVRTEGAKKTVYVCVLIAFHDWN